jgi:hypothetical protein
MRLGKDKVVIVVFACFAAGAQAVLAQPSLRPCEPLSRHFVQTCHCHPKYDTSARHRGRHPIAGFDTEYDVEKWEKAYRQGRALWGTRSKHRRCLSSGL